MLNSWGSRVLLISICVLFLSGSCSEAFRPVYTIQHVTSFRSEMIHNAFGCDSRVAFGYYQYPDGALDALHIVTEPYRYAVSLNCRHDDQFALVFGSNQNYEQLLKTEPSSVSSRVKSLLGRFASKNIIVEWRELLRGQFPKVQKWLKGFVQELEGAGFTVYLKAPASFFCYTEGGQRYILGVPAKNYIVDMYGENAIAYTNYEEIFTSQKNTKFASNEQYPDTECPEYPSLQMLGKFTGNFFMGATLQTEEPGFMGSRLKEYINKAGERYGKLVFLDDYPPNIIAN